MVEEESQQKKKAFYVSMQRIQRKKNYKIFITRKRADMVRRLGIGPGLILERKCAKDKQGDSDAERTSDQENTNQMRAP
jgi:hypothetical protein